MKRARRFNAIKKDSFHASVAKCRVARTTRSPPSQGVTRSANSFLRQQKLQVPHAVRRLSILPIGIMVQA